MKKPKRTKARKPKPKKTRYKKKPKKSTPKKQTKKKQPRLHSLKVNAPGGIENLIDTLVQKASAQQKKDLLDGIHFWDWLQQQPPPDYGLMINYSSHVFRVVGAARSPTSVLGAVSCGGRYNIGGAQLTSVPPLDEIRAFSSVYAADSLDCAVCEARVDLPIDNSAYKAYKLIPLRAFRLWVIQEIAEIYSWRNLPELLEQTPLSANWGLQKVPKVSQLLGAYLKSFGGDGLIFASTKSEKDSIIAVFAEDDREALGMFNVEEVAIPSTQPKFKLE
jgi:hypothetical protein